VDIIAFLLFFHYIGSMTVTLQVHKIPKILAWKGLIGSKPQPILFKTRFGIHTIGVRYPIDVIILDRKNIVQKIKEGLQPNSLFFWNPSFNKVVELPHGTIKDKKLKINQKIALEYI